MFERMRARKKRLVSRALVEKMRSWKEQGLTYREISEKVQMPLATVFYYIKKGGGWEVPEFFTRLTEGQKGYIAGIIDGEGTIALYRVNNKRYSEQYRRVEIRLANTKKELVDYLKALVPEFYVGRRTFYDKYTDRRKPLFSLSLSRTVEQYYLLKAILPYLVIKREIAKKCLEYLEDHLRGIKEAEEA